MKKNNKGFSLVELIVVVLIMGILAVALAPQVMKWVGTARDNGARNNAESVKAALQDAIADYMSQGGGFTSAANTEITNWTNSTAADPGWFTNATDAAKLAACVDEVTGKDYKTKVGKITIDGKGVVTVEEDK